MYFTAPWLYFCCIHYILRIAIARKKAFSYASFDAENLVKATIVQFAFNFLFENPR